MKTQLLVGTSKGLVIFKYANNLWSIDVVQFEGLPVSLVYVDDRTLTWWLGI